MIKTLNRLWLAVPVALAGTTAMAGGISEPIIAPAPAPVAVAPVVVPVGADWTGFYVGGNLGYGQVQSDALTEDVEGMTYGVHAGYLYDLGSFVVGGELEYDMTDIVDDGTDIALDSVARAKVRAGYDAGSFLPYVTAGIAQATTSGGLDATDTGAFAGIGLDYQMPGSALRVGAEVLQHQFEDFDGSGADIDATTASVRVGFTF